MRTNIEIDGDLMDEVMKITGQKTKKAAVEAAFHHVIETSKRIKALNELRGMGWEGDLDQMRNDWSPEVDWGLQNKQ